MTALFNRWLPGATLFAWSAVLFYFHFSGRLRDFLIPMFRPMVLVAGVALLLMAVGMLLTRSADSPCCEASATCAHTVTGSLAGRFLTFFVLLVPVVCAAVLSPGGFGLNAILNRGVVTDAASLQPRAPAVSVEPPLPTKDGPAAPEEEVASSTLDYLPRTPEGYVIAEVIDFLYAAQEVDLRGDFEGQTVSVIGQLMPEKTNNPAGNRFKLVRMFMTCCAADARPVGVTVEPEEMPAIPEMTWVRVVARVEFPVVGGRETALLKATEVTKTPPPEESMLF